MPWEVWCCCILWSYRALVSSNVWLLFHGNLVWGIAGLCQGRLTFNYLLSVEELAIPELRIHLHLFEDTASVPQPNRVDQNKQDKAKDNSPFYICLSEVACFCLRAHSGIQSWTLALLLCSRDLLPSSVERFRYSA